MVDIVEKKNELKEKLADMPANVSDTRTEVVNLVQLGEEMRIPVEYINREELATISTPNPSKTVQAFEGTSSVSEASAIKSSNGELIVEKQKFPPNLTLAIARMIK